MAKKSLSSFHSYFHGVFFHPNYQFRLLTILLRDILSCQILQNAMDALANPENVNRLLIVWLEESNTVLESHNIESDTGVPMLNSFTNDCLPKPKEMVGSLVN